MQPRLQHIRIRLSDTCYFDRGLTIQRNSQTTAPRISLPTNSDSIVPKMPDHVEPMYFSAILDGLCSRYGNQGTDEKEVNEKQIAAFPTEKFLIVIDRLDALRNRPCGSAIVNCIRRLSARMLPPRVLEIASYYAVNDPNPSSDIWKDTRDCRNYYGGDPHSHGINCVRGQAAEALSELLYDDHARFNALHRTWVAFAADAILSCRCV